MVSVDRTSFVSQRSIDYPEEDISLMVGDVGEDLFPVVKEICSEGDAIKQIYIRVRQHRIK